MALVAEQVDWLRLTEVSGPFLAGRVLQEVFPQGLEKVDTPRRQRLRAAYDEWRDAVDEADPQLHDLHSAWIQMVFREALEFDDQVLVGSEDLVDVLHYSPPDVSEVIVPDFAIRSDDGIFRLLISVHPPETDLQGPISDRWTASPAERMILLCRGNRVRVGLVTNGEEWLVVNAPVGGTSGWCLWNSRFWGQELVTLKAFQSLLGVRRIFGPDNERLDSLLERSLVFQEEVTDTLGEQVRRAVEMLVQSLARADQDREGVLLRDVSSSELYEAGLTVMMRLVFILCAEERGLMLLGDLVYDRFYAISTLRGLLREDADRYGVEVLERKHDAWSRILSVFRIVYGGIAHESLRTAALGGSLFDPDRFPFLEGRAVGTTWLRDSASPLPIDNRTVLLLLDALQMLEQNSGAQSLSYRALDVEQIGHVYEGLLEYTVTRVTQPTLGLVGTQKVPSPHITLSALEALIGKGRESAVEELNLLTDRSSSALNKALARKTDEASLLKAIHACNGDEQLGRRILPFIYLIRADSWGNLVVYNTGSVAVVYGGSRRETGSHYTPKSLAELIVQKTLDPIVHVGPAEGHVHNEWKLKGSCELLDLKICDPAMGSGAFLVQVCRYLGSKVVEAWAAEEDHGCAITSDGTVRRNIDGKEPLTKDPHERLMAAQRLVAERCLYGVDVNPLAVELAKLSIWLVTMSKGRPFGFLNHNLRCGDSLVGIIELDQLVNLKPSRSENEQIGMFGGRIGAEIEKAIELRSRMRGIPIRDFVDIKEISRLHTLSRLAVEGPMVVADALVFEILTTGRYGPALDQKLQNLKLRADELFKQTPGSYEKLRSSHQLDVPAGRPNRSSLHWCIEFPEVFCRDNPGFDCVVGNPPFLGNRLWKPFLGEHILWQAEIILGRKPSKTDLCVLFHRRVVELLRRSGAYGLLGTTNIAEGTSVALGLGEEVKRGDIFFCRKRMVWPAKLDVHVSIVCFYKGKYLSAKYADEVECTRIGPRLESESVTSWEPKRLSDSMFACEGVNNSQGLAFIVKPTDEWYHILKAERGSLLQPYVTGKDITEHSLSRVSRFALDVSDRSLDEIRSAFPEAYRFLETTKPTRTEEVLKSYKGLIERWWQFWNHRADQMGPIRKMSSDCVVFSKNTKHSVCLLAPSDWIYTNKVVVVGMSRPDILPICLSSVFGLWLRRFCGGTLKRIALTITIESIDTFPLPPKFVGSTGILEANLFVQKCRRFTDETGVGLTAIMDLVHDPSCSNENIASLRAHMQAIDQSVSEAYGWIGLEITHAVAEAGTLIPGSGSRLQLPYQSQQMVINLLLDLNRIRSANA